MPKVLTPALLTALLAAAPTLAADSDARVPVQMPEMMKDHMRANMRDHLLALQEIQSALARDQYDEAATIAEQRLGMSSLGAHGAQHMAGLMPEGMQAIGTGMHRAASRFAVTAQEAAVGRDLSAALQALSEVTRQCVTCHAGYRIKSP
jgi:cytochrome c556